MSILYFDAAQNDVTELNQWGLYEELLISGAPTSPAPSVLFSNGCCGDVISVEPYIDNCSLVVIVPNEVLQAYGSVSVYLYQKNSDGSATTLDRVRIPVRPRPRPGNYYEIIEESEREGGILRLSVGRLDLNVLG